MYTPTRNNPGAPGSSNLENCVTEPNKTPKDVITSLLVIADLPNAQKQNEETKNMSQGNEQEKSPEKKLYEMKQPKYYMQCLKQWL